MCAAALHLVRLFVDNVDDARGVRDAVCAKCSVLGSWSSDGAVAPRAVVRRVRHGGVTHWRAFAAARGFSEYFTNDYVLRLRGVRVTMCGSRGLNMRAWASELVARAAPGVFDARICGFRFGFRFGLVVC